MTTMTIGFIGLGRIGKALAQKSVKAGNRVILSKSKGSRLTYQLRCRAGPVGFCGHRS
jgi:predicted dinucleotide-binding enzyme